ncbi:MAG TPA: heparinase II/III family protein, partial [Armatimonadota bacterium]|nr:heparinase II/III family protein [Armatimonadota bacterium]
CGVADALQGVAEAYDLIYNYDGLSETDHRVIRAKIANACERLYLSALESGSGQHPGNQRTRGICALGTAAIVLAGYEDAAHTPDEWLQRALDGIRDEPNFEFWRPDGMFIEGPGYSSFTLATMMPFTRYYENASGNWLFDDPRLSNAIEYTIHITQPDGVCAAIGTTNMQNVINSLKLCVGAGSERQQQMIRWALEEWGSIGSGGVRELCLFDDSVQPSMAGVPTSRYYTTTQEAAMRSEWSRNAVALWFKSKDPWLAKTHHVYSHGDVGSFVLHAYGELLAVDAGYDHWVSYDLYPPQLHNTLLVDGEGPVNETPGTIENIIDAPYVRSADIVTEYAGIKLRRTFLLVEGEFVVIIDDIQADEEHEYEWQIHTPVSREGGEIEIDGNRASWTGFDPKADTPGKVALDVYWAGPVEVEAVETSRWQPYGSDPKTASYDNWAVVARQQGKDVKYLTVLYPHAVGAATRQVTDRTDDEQLSLTVDREQERVWATVSTVADRTESTPRAKLHGDTASSPWWYWIAGPGGVGDEDVQLAGVSAEGVIATEMYPGRHVEDPVHVAGPEGMEVTTGLARRPGLAWHIGEKWRPVDRTDAGAGPLTLPEAIVGPAQLAWTRRPLAEAGETTPPDVVAVTIDDQQRFVGRQFVDLGRVAAPPWRVSVEFRDEGMKLNHLSGRVALNGVPLPNSSVIAMENRQAPTGTLTGGIPKVTDPIDYEVSFRASDNALRPNMTQFNLHFSLAPLLENGGFEDGGDSPHNWGLGAWSSSDETKYESEAVTDNPHSGKRCLMMRGIAGGLNMVASQVVPLEIGKTYRMTGYHRGDVGSKASMCSQSGKNQYIYSDPLPPSDEWIPFEWEFTVTNPEARLIIAMRLGAVGTVYYDDLSLAEVE